MGYPSISIIVPVYNVADYILACLDSVAQQDYQGPVECILVDDHSTDSSLRLIQEYVNAYEGPVRFVILCQEERKKQSAARNKAFTKATGDYIFYLDADDWLSPVALSSLASVLTEHPNCQLVQAGVSTTDPGVYRWLDYKTWGNEEIEYTEDRKWIVDVCARRMSMIPMTPVSKLISRKFLAENNISFYEGIFHEDDLWLVCLSKHLQSVAFVRQNLYFYRIREDSTVGGGKTVYFKDRELVWTEIMKSLDKDFFPQSIISQIERDTTEYLERYRNPEVRKMILGIKWRLLCISPCKYKLVILKRLVKSILCKHPIAV